jgi:hypothetical protein
MVEILKFVYVMILFLVLIDAAKKYERKSLFHPFQIFLYIYFIHNILSHFSNIILFSLFMQ